MLPSTNNQGGYTFIELLIVMLILSILVGYGAQFIGSAFTGADRRVSIIEMRNMANALFILKQSGTTTLNNFPQSGTLVALNASQTMVQLPATNNFGYAYYFSLTPTIAVSTTIPQNASPIGVISEHPVTISIKIISGVISTTTITDYGFTIITVHYRPKIPQKEYPRLAWVKRFYYNEPPNDLRQKQTNQGDFLPNNILGKFAPREY